MYNNSGERIAKYVKKDNMPKGGQERMSEMEKYVLGIDIGTTSVKTVLLSSSGKMVAEATRGHDLLSLHRN